MIVPLSKNSFYIFLNAEFHIPSPATDWTSDGVISQDNQTETCWVFHYPKSLFLTLSREQCYKTFEALYLQAYGKDEKTMGFHFGQIVAAKIRTGIEFIGGT